MTSLELIITALCFSIVIGMGYVVYCLFTSVIDTKPYRIH